MKTRKTQTWKEFKSELLSDTGVRKEYEKLGPQYELASELIAARIKKGLTQAELAEKVGTGQSAIARLESADYNPSLKMLRRVAEATGTKVLIRLQSL